MTFFVTGATGFVGGVVSRQLAAAGFRVRALVRSPQAASSLAAAGLELHAGDVVDKASMRLGSGERAKRELGWTVRPLREGLTETLRHEIRLQAVGARRQ